MEKREMSLFMPVCTLYTKMQEEPLPLVVDLYSQTVVPSITAESEDSYNELIEPLEYDFFATDTEEKAAFISWKSIKNNMFYTKGFVDIFKEDKAALLIAYEAMSLVFMVYPGPDFYASDLHVFHYDDKEFWVKAEGERVLFFTPEEY